MDEDERERDTCAECGEEIDEGEDYCDECEALASDPEALMHGTISDETIQRFAE